MPTPDGYELGAAEERSRIVWWLRAAAEGPGGVNSDASYTAAIRDMADVIEQHPDRFAQAPPFRPSLRQRTKGAVDA